MKRFLTVLVLILGTSTLTYSQISIEDCREMARNNHPAIRMYGLVGATRECSFSNASRQWIPAVRLGGMAGVYNNVSSFNDLFAESDELARWVGDKIIDRLNIVDPSPFTYKVEAQLSQKIYDGGMSRASKNLADAKAQVQMAEADVTLDQVCDRVDEVYYSILLLEQRQMQAESKTKVLLSARNRVLSLYDAGTARQGELDEVDAAYIEAEQQKAALESSLKSFRMALSLLVGKDVSSEKLLRPTVPLMPHLSPQMLLLDNQFKLLSLEREKLNVACRPRLDLVADAYYGYPNRNIFMDQVSLSPRVNAFVGVRLSWDLAAFYTRKNDLGILKNSLEEINIQKDIVSRNIDIQNSSIYVEIDRLQQCLEKDNELVRLRERLRKSAELSYSQGDINANDLISRIDDEYQARLNAEIHEIETLQQSNKLRR